MKLKKIIVALAMLTVVALVGAGCGGSGSDEAASNGEKGGDKVVIGTQDLLDTSVIAKSEGYFQEAMGDNVEIERLSAGRDINNALMSDSVEFGMMGICPTTVGLSSDAGYKVIWIEDLIRGTEGLVAKTDSGINSVKDLKGKKVGVTLASSGHYGLLCALQDEGMTSEDIEMVDLAPDAINSAWARGDIDVAYTWNPTLINLKNSGGKVLLTGADMAKRGHQTINFHVVRTDFAEENPELVKQYCAALAKGVNLYYEDRDAAYDIVSKYLEMTVENAKEQMSDEYIKLENQLDDNALGADNAAKSIYEVAKFLEKEGQIEDARDLEYYKSMIDTSYIEALQAEQK